MILIFGEWIIEVFNLPFY